jgi:hypothetical protein
MEQRRDRPVMIQFMTQKNREVNLTIKFINVPGLEFVDALGMQYFE